MYILSKKKDYYDGVVGTMGIDKTIVYNREIIEVKENDFPEFMKKKSYSWKKSKDTPFINMCNHSIKKECRDKYITYSHFIIGFCGKLYIGWKLYNEVRNNLGSTDLITEITYDFDYVYSLLEVHRYYGDITNDVDYINKFNALELFRDFNSPIFVYDTDYNRTSIGKYCRREKSKLIINPNLSQYQFYKVFDSFQAFQEIQMFLGGVLGAGEKEIPEVQDKYKIAQHGFDKWSFRREPQNKK